VPLGEQKVSAVVRELFARAQQPSLPAKPSDKCREASCVFSCGDITSRGTEKLNSFNL